MEENNTVVTPSAKKAYRCLGFALLTTVAVSVLLQLLAILLAKTYGGQTEQSWLIWLMTFVPIYAVGIPLGLLVMRCAPVEKRKTVKLGAKNFFIFLLMCFPIMYGGNLLGTGLSYLLSNGTAENALESYAFDESLLKIFVMVFLAPLLEEFFFHKQILDRCAQYGEKTAILFSAVSFALFHMNLYQFFYAFGLGLLFAYVCVRTGKLRYSVLMHMTVNFVGSVIAPYLLSHVDLERMDPAALAQLSDAEVMALLPSMLGFLIYCLAILGLSIAGLVLIIVKAPKLVFLPAREEIQKGQRFRTVYANAGTILFFVICVAVSVVSLFINQ